MGNKPKKSPSKLLFEYDIRSPYPSKPKPKPSQNSLNPPKTPPKAKGHPLEASPAEFIETLNFCFKNQKINDICEPQLILTQANALFLNNEAIKNNETPKIHNFLTHAQIIQIHAHLEYYNEFNTMAKSQILYNNNINKSVAMSPIQIRNSNKAEEFNTPSPLKSEFKVNFKENVEIVENDENYEKNENLQKKNEIYQKNENFSKKIQKNEENNQRTMFLKPSFVHFSRQLTKKNRENIGNDQEEDLELSLKRIDEKLRKNKYFLKENREISNNEVKYMKLDLWKTKEKPSYLDLSIKKPRKNLENSPEKEEIYQINYNLNENRVKTPKKPISNENNKIQSFYSYENLKKYLNKSHSDFSNNSRFLVEKRPVSPHVFAENRGNFLYMNYDYDKKQKLMNSMRKITNIERENLENSLINLKKSLNLPQKAKIMRRTAKKEENYSEETQEVDLKSVEVEKLRRSLVFSKKMRLGVSKEN